MQEDRTLGFNLCLERPDRADIGIKKRIRLEALFSSHR